MSRYVIIGAGAIGSALGGCLAGAGVETVLVGRQAHVEAIGKDGLRVRTPESDERVEVPAVTGPDQLRLTTDDVLVLTTKTHQATAALLEWADADVYPAGGTAGPAEPVGSAWELLPVCTALNGVTSETMALRRFRRVFAVCVWMPAVYLEPGEVIVRATPRRGIFHVGAFHRLPEDTENTGDTGDDGDDGDNGRRADREFLTRMQADWRAGACEVALPDDVMAWKYRKLISNLGNSVQALVGQADDEQTDDGAGPGAAEVLAAAEVEARAVLTGCGIAFTDDETERAARANSFRVEPVADEPAELGGSSWQSLARGSGSIETDYLNGEIARLARAHGLAAPVNERLAALARLAAKESWQPGSMTGADLAGRVGLAGREGL